MAAGHLRLLKVPRWLSEEWLKSKPQDIVADLDLDQGILRLNSTRAGRAGCPTTLRVERRPSPELFSFWQPLDGSEAPIEGIAEALTVRPDLRDQSYRSLLDQRKEEETAASSRRSRHEERLIQGDERPAVVRATKPPAEGPGAALQDVLAVVEKALQSAGTLGLTGLELFERLPMGGCTLAQLRDSLLALAIPIQAEDGARRYVQTSSTVEQVLVRILPGVYQEQLCITEPVVLVGAGKELPTIWGGKDGVVVSGSGASACALRHLRFCAEPNSHALTVSNSSPLIEGCEIVGSSGSPARGAPAGLEVRGESCPVIRECRVFDHAGLCRYQMWFPPVICRLLSWQDDDGHDGQRQFRRGATQPMAAAEARRPSAQEAAAAEALARHLRGRPRPALDPLLDTPLSAASTIVSPALSDASWELPEAAGPTDEADQHG
ncbi:unnamed protein product [Symbiodinium natans]|uniref:Uncharacterized protein n=1 Tax=Symbiodinium natans TaxID=878477 RepID=A0A812LBG0_9DINO|nr:unnamed protein product [Symbiodinium natans]